MTGKGTVYTASRGCWWHDVCHSAMQLWHTCGRPPSLQTYVELADWGRPVAQPPSAVVGLHAIHVFVLGKRVFMVG